MSTGCIKIVLPLITAICLSSCKKQLDPNSYRNWISKPENGLSKMDNSNGVTITAQLKPLEYVGFTENQLFKRENLAEWKNENEDFIFFDFHLKPPKNFDGANEFDLERLSLLAGGIKEQFRLILGMDTVTCFSAHYESAGGIWSEYKFILSFHLVQRKEEVLKLLYTDELFNTGLHEFLFDIDDLEAAPLLNLQ